MRADVGMGRPVRVVMYELRRRQVSRKPKLQCSIALHHVGVTPPECYEQKVLGTQYRPHQWHFAMIACDSV